MGKSRPQTRLNSRLSGLATPMALIGNDRKVLFFNQGFEQLTGWSASLVVGSICEYTSEGDPQSVRALLGSLCPPPQVFDGQALELPAFLPRQSGRPIARQVRYCPLRDAAGQIDCVLIIVSDIEPTSVITTISPTQRLHAELIALRAKLRQRFGISTIIAKCDAMLRVVQQVQLAIQGNTSLLLEGEPGTGKEHIARVIHHETHRSFSLDTDVRAGAFVPLDCAKMLPIDLKRTLRRIFRSLNEEESQSSPPPGGVPRTVYLDSLEAMPREVQEFVVTSMVKESGELPLRLMAGTKENPETLVKRDVIRADFFYLISPLRIALPPLRNRGEDLPLLAQGFLERMNVGTDPQFEGFAEEAWKEICEYNWPGNLDELAGIIEEARAACAGVVIGREHLPFRFRVGRDAQTVGPRVEPQPRPLEAYLEQVEREHIEWALEQTRYNKKKTADILGLTRPKLYRRMEALGILDRDEEDSV